MPSSPAIEEDPLDEAEVLGMLQDYLALYNDRDYVDATAHLSTHVKSECGGATNLAYALSQNHETEGINYGAKAVTAWGPDDPNMADVTTVESYGGESFKQDLGLAFVLAGGEWKLDDLYPLGAGAFC